MRLLIIIISLLLCPVHAAKHVVNVSFNALEKKTMAAYSVKGHHICTSEAAVGFGFASLFGQHGGVYTIFSMGFILILNWIFELVLVPKLRNVGSNWGSITMGGHASGLARLHRSRAFGEKEDGA